MLAPRPSVAESLCTACRHGHKTLVKPDGSKKVRCHAVDQADVRKDPANRFTVTMRHVSQVIETFCQRALAGSRPGNEDGRTLTTPEELVHGVADLQPCRPAGDPRGGRTGS